MPGGETATDRGWRMTDVRFVLGALALVLVSGTGAGAQVTIDVSKITCEQFVLYQIPNADYIPVWLSGYYSAKRGTTLVDPQALKANIEKVRDYCRGNFKTTIMQAVETVLAPQK
jgi:acid stress chaperone HdeB